MFEVQDLTNLRLEKVIDYKHHPRSKTTTVLSRFPYQADNIESFMMEIIREQLVKRQLMDASAKSLIKLLTVTCGYGEVRQLAAQKLELWLQNPKVGTK